MRIHYRALAALAAVLLAAFTTLSAQDGEQRVILISIDGLMPSAYTGADSQTPNL